MMVETMMVKTATNGQEAPGPVQTKPKGKGKIWGDRGEALTIVLSNYGEVLNPKPNTQKPEGGLIESPQPEAERDRQNLYVLSEALKSFAKAQWEFFQDGFFSRNTYHLIESREFPPDYVMGVISGQIAEDLELIRRVVDQRNTPTLQEALQRADKLIARALQPACNAFIKEEEMPLPLGYFQKAASVRIIPYARVALIGIPFTATQVNRDYLAIPHEVGHYVYRNGRIDDQPIPPQLGQNLLKPVAELVPVQVQAGLGAAQGQAKVWKPADPIPRYVLRWKEEIFADVYGCMVSGPEVALSFRDLVRGMSRLAILQTPSEHLYGQLTEDDGIHPVPALRPFVYTQVLAKQGYIELANRLEEKWRKELADNGVTEFRTRYLGPNLEYISLSDGEKALRAAVDKVYELLKSHIGEKAGWSSQISDDPGDDEVYTNFDRLINELGKTESSKIQACSDTDIKVSWKEWIKREDFFPGLPVEQQPPKKPTRIEPGKAQRIEALELEPRYTWNHVFLAGGWSTRVDGAHGTGVVLPKNWRGQGSEGGSSTY